MLKRYRRKKDTQISRERQIDSLRQNRQREGTTERRLDGKRGQPSEIDGNMATNRQVNRIIGQK